MMFQINNPAHYNQAHSTHIFRNAYYLDTESRNTHALQFEPSVPRKNISQTNSSGVSEYGYVISQNAASSTYGPTWPTWQSFGF